MLRYERAHEEALREYDERQLSDQIESGAFNAEEMEIIRDEVGEENIFEIPEGLDLADVIKSLEKTEAELGLERVKPEHRMNRKQRRDAVREIKRMTRRPSGIQRRLEHPVLKSLTPWGVKELLRRRARAKMARKSRQAHYQQAAVVRRRRQKISNRRRQG
jgi:hypothetical protein